MKLSSQYQPVNSMLAVYLLYTVSSALFVKWHMYLALHSLAASSNVDKLVLPESHQLTSVSSETISGDCNPIKVYSTWYRRAGRMTRQIRIGLGSGMGWWSNTNTTSAKIKKSLHKLLCLKRAIRMNHSFTRNCITQLPFNCDVHLIVYIYHFK